ncbi:MAG: acyl-CoA dehydrogenase family protein, partial [Bacteroidota bacterium]|nr:acyl-CoA dehydrogenase family protein [Bacteroidota bacterium]
MAFQGVDYYRLDDLLTPEQELVRQTVRDFVEAEVIPIIEQHYREGTYPMHLVPRMAELGLFGITLPSDYGCAGADNITYGLVMQELERGDSAVRSFVSVQSALVMYPIYTYGTEEQRRKWLPKLARGEAIGCFGLTEPDYGSNPAGMLTTARRTSCGFVLNGTKMWITNGSIADVAVVWAKLDGEIHGFIVERGTPGFTTVEMKNKHSLRASVTSELIFQDCEIPKENMLQVHGLKGPLSCLTQARYGIAWGAVGSAMATFEVALNYAKTRIQFGRPIASFQLIQDKLVWMLTEITKAQLLCFRLG